MWRSPEELVMIGFGRSRVVMMNEKNPFLCKKLSKNMNISIEPNETGRVFWRTPSITIARLTLESYFRSGWMWAEFVLVLVFFAALFFSVS